MDSSSSSMATLSNLHHDIIKAHILPRLDGPSLLAVGSSSSDLRSLCSDDSELWKAICQSTWPSLDDPRVSEAISTFPSGHRSFYQDSFPILHPTHRNSNSNSNSNSKLVPTTERLISAIDICYKNKLVYSHVEVTEAATESFLRSPFWVELPTSETCFSRVNFEEGDKEFLEEVEETVRLNWIVIDTTRKRAGNFSSVRPIFARRHWMTNEVQLRFAIILPAAGDPSEFVQCKIDVTCRGGKEVTGELHVREVTMYMHDMDFKCLLGEECLVLLIGAMEGGRRKLGKRGEEKVKYEEFLNARKERFERRDRMELRNAKLNRTIQLTIFVLLLVCPFWISYF